MPKLKPAKLPNKTPNTISKIQNWYKSLSKIVKLTLALALIISLLFGVGQALIYKEKTTYKNAEKQIATFVDEAAKLAPSAKRLKNKYCSRISEKFDDGALICVVEEKLIFQGISLDSFKSVMAAVQKHEAIANWTKEFTEQSSEGTPGTVAKTIYRFNNLTCGIYYRQPYVEEVSSGQASVTRDYIIEISCSGPAQREYY
ncbi:hypothetical protein IPL85_01915 [Candidatus Saccharibacteria bacterium]|nr:MAG: hypothetical protein IPL85_01915 [Candidatus Saccharibacteria bacterium]